MSFLKITWLVVEPTHLKNMLVKMGNLPQIRDENEKSLSCHHQVTAGLCIVKEPHKPKEAEKL